MRSRTRVADCPAAKVATRERDATERAKHLPLSFVAKRAREQAGLTQIDVSKLTRAPRWWVQKWETGEGAPRLDHLQRAPSDYALPLLRWAAQQHDHDVARVAEDVHGEDDSKRTQSVTSAVVNALRALPLLNSDAADLEILERACRRGVDELQECAARAAELIRRKRRGV